MARNRGYTQRELPLVLEWAARTFPHATLRTRVYLGSLTPAVADPHLTEAEKRRLGIMRRYVDLLAIEPETVHLAEGKVRGEPGALEQLDLYARLLPLTDELAELRGRPIVRHLVWAIPDPVIEALARQRGILVHVYRPSWLEPMLAELRPRQTTATQPRGLLEDLERGK